MNEKTRGGGEGAVRGLEGGWHVEDSTCFKSLTNRSTLENLEHFTTEPFFMVERT